MVAHPSSLVPAFTTERLCAIADVIRRVRAKAVESHLPEEGDGDWTFGCVCYQRTVFALANLAKSDGNDWLKVVAPGLACTLYVEDVPVKFYTGDPSRPTERARRRALEEAAKQGRLPFFDDMVAAETDGWFWLIAINTLEGGGLSSIAILQSNREGETRNIWHIPEDPIAVVVPAEAPKQEGVELPPVVVGPKPASTEETAGKEGDGGGSK
jgi:hypothetical protein